MKDFFVKLWGLHSSNSAENACFPPEKGMSIIAVYIILYLATDKSVTCRVN